MASCLTCSLILKTHSSKTLAGIQQSYIPEDKFFITTTVRTSNPAKSLLIAPKMKNVFHFSLYHIFCSFLFLVHIQQVNPIYRQDCMKAVMHRICFNQDWLEYVVKSVWIPCENLFSGSWIVITNLTGTHFRSFQ
jgi:hypothetical protein